MSKLPSDFDNMLHGLDDLIIVRKSDSIISEHENRINNRINIFDDDNYKEIIDDEITDYSINEYELTRKYNLKKKNIKTRLNDSDEYKWSVYDFKKFSYSNDELEDIELSFEDISPNVEDSDSFGLSYNTVY